MKTRMSDVLKIASAFLLVFVATVHSQEQNILLQEQFDNISNWEPLLFPKIKEHSSYTVVADDEGSYLKAQSNASASALIYKKKFNVSEFPYVRWRWKVENLYEKGNAKNKKGGDYPIRIVEDYRAAFGESPPQVASIAIMNDSDNTKESSTSCVDYIEVFSK